MFRRCFALLIGLTVSGASAMVSAQDVIDVWIGTGRTSFSKGIYHCTLDWTWP
mgnify:FL=1